jgi:hypothetical protein
MPNGALLEVKGGEGISLTPQLQAQISIAQSTGAGIVLVVRPGAVVYRPPYNAIMQTPGGQVLIYNVITGQFTPYVP